MAARGWRSWAHTSRARVGTASVADLAARAPGDVLAPAVSVLGTVSGAPTLATVTTWTLFAVVFYESAPLVYSLSDALPREEPGFRALFAGGAVALGLLVGDATAPVALFVRVVPLTAVMGGLFLWYLWAVRGWVLLSPDGQLVGVLQLFSPHADASTELEQDLSHDGALGLLAAGLYLAAAALVLALPVFMAAILSRALLNAAPLPDVLFLGWAVAASVSPRLSVGPSRERVLDARFDLEEYLVDALENATRGTQGLYLSALCLFGTFGAAGYLYLALAFLPTVTAVLDTAPRALAHPSPAELAILWNLAGTFVLLLLAGGFALWAWVREWHRVPHFLDRWEGRETVSGDPVPRPPGLTAAPAAAFATAGAFLLGASRGVAAPETLPSYAYAALWPAVAAVQWLAYRRARRGRSQPLTYENYWIGGGVLVQMVPLLLLASGAEDGAGLLDRLGPAVLFVLLVAAATTLPVATRRDGRTDGTSYAFVWYLFGLAALTLLALPVTPRGYTATVLLFASVCVAGGAALGFTRWRGL